MSDYTPTTEEVLGAWTTDSWNTLQPWKSFDECVAVSKAAFDRWLAAHDIEVLGRLMGRMEEYKDSCDYNQEDGECFGYEACPHSLPTIYFELKNSGITPIHGDGEQE